MAPDSPEGRARSKSRIFISYSRKDIEFADRLELALRESGFVTLIDRAEILALEDWWKRIETLVTQADTVIFVLSPEALASDVCKKEVEFADSLNKRLAPVVLRRAADSDIPASLARLNFVFFDDPATFEQRLDQLVEALNTDISWIRNHTDIGEQARRWSIAGRPGPHGLLLRSPVLEDAERWIASRPEGAPLPTQDVIDFIAESRRGATRRRNMLTASLGTGLVIAAVLAGLAYWQRNVAIDQRILAEGRQVTSLANLGTSERLRGNWDSALKLGIYTAKLRSALGLPDSIDQLVRSSLAGTISQSALQLILSDQNAKATFADFSPDGTQIVTASEDGIARIWDASTGKLFASLAADDHAIYCARFSPDGSKIVTASGDNAAHIWELSTGRELMKLEGHEFYVTAAAFSADGKRLVTASGDSSARVWDAQSGKQLLLLAGHDSYVEDAAFNREGTKIVTASSDYTAVVWDAVTGKQLTKFEKHMAPIMSARFNPKGDHVVTGSNDGTVRIWDAATAEEIKVITGHGGFTVSANFNQDGTKVVTAAVDGSAHIWDAETGVEIETLAGHEGPLQSAAFSADGSQIVTTSEDNTTRIWRPEFNISKTIKGEPIRAGADVLPITGENFSPDGSKLLAVEHEDAVVWDVRTAKQLGLVDIDEASVETAIYTPDGKQILMLVTDLSDHDKPVSTLQLWDSASYKQVSTIYKVDRDRDLKLIGYSHDGASILLNNIKTVIVLNAATGAESHRITQDEDIGVVALSPDDKRLANVGMTKHVAHILDLEKGAEVFQIQVKAASPEIIRSIEFSPDGKRLLVSHAGYSVVWDADSGDTITELHGHSNRSVVTVSRFSPDGSRIVTAATDNTARVWDAVNGELIKTFRAITGEVPTAAFHPSAAFSPDGKFIAFEADDKSLRLWSAESAMMPTSPLIDLGCKRLASFRTLNASEKHLVGLDHINTNVDACGPIPETP
jgi:WD40 repeat protein